MPNSTAIGEASGAAAERPSRRLPEWFAPLVSLMILCLLLSLRSKNFATQGNVISIASQTAVVAILAVGETVIIIAGGIDLSVGSVLALAGMVAGLLMRAHVPVLLAVLAAIAVGVTSGSLAGSLTAKTKIPAFITTLGMMGICRGAALLLAKHFHGGTPVFELPRSFVHLGDGALILIPTLVVALAGHILLHFTRLGRHLYAIGGNTEAARLSGLPVAREVLFTFCLSGALAAFGGVLHAARISVASPTEGTGYELDAIAAAVIGGASLMGGEGTVVGTLIGAVLMSVLRNGLNLMNADVDWQQVVIGALVVLAVLYDHLRRRR